VNAVIVERGNIEGLEILKKIHRKTCQAFLSVLYGKFLDFGDIFLEISTSPEPYYRSPDGNPNLVKLFLSSGNIAILFEFISCVFFFILLCPA